MAYKILVMGANGYIGRHVVRTLVELGHKVVASSRRAQPVDTISQYLPLDILDRSAVRSAVANCDFVFMLAGLTGTAIGFERYREFIETNEIGILNVLDALRSDGSQAKLVFPSSRLVYQGVPEALKEDAPKEFKTIYALTKFAGEIYLQLYSQYFGIRYSVFRICVPYGSLLGKELSFGTIGHFMTQARRTKRIRIYGDGSQRRSLIHIEDLAHLLVEGALNPATDNGTFNIGGPDDLSVRDIAEAVAGIYQAEVDFAPWPELDAKIESGDTVFDSSALCNLLGYRYRHTFWEWVSKEKAE